MNNPYNQFGNQAFINANGATGVIQPQQPQQYYQQPGMVPGYGQQPQPQQFVGMMQSGPTVFHGVIVDRNWVTPELIGLENPNNIIQNSELRNIYLGRLPHDASLRSVTSRILGKMDAENKSFSYIRFLSSTDPNWAIDFKIDLDTVTRTKRVYIEKANSATNVHSTISIDRLIQGGVNSGNNEWGLCFAAITSETNLPSVSAAKLYSDAIYHTLLYLERVITDASGKYIRIVNGKWTMSATLYELLIDGAISIGGILIKPIVSIDERTGQLLIGFKLDFREDITVNFKGDREYNGNTVFTSAK